jgi:hypothetical protein
VPEQLAQGERDVAALDDVHAGPRVEVEDHQIGLRVLAAVGQPDPPLRDV